MINFLISLLISFCIGTASGGVLVYKAWSVSDLKSQVSAYKEDSKRYRSAVGIAQTLDEENAESAKANSQHISAVMKTLIEARAKASEPEPKCEPQTILQPVVSGWSTEVIKYVHTKPKQKRRVAGPDDICVDAASMRYIKQIH